MLNTNLPIGVFDSGVGGISVLAELVRLLPNEKYLYYGDDLHSPYGTKQTREVQKYALEGAAFLYAKGIKSLVIACNTATSVAIQDIRSKYDFIPVLGMEPALKPAVKLHPVGKIVVMATPLTLREKKFENLLLQFHDEADIVPLACPGLVELIENADFHSENIKRYLTDLFSGIDLTLVEAIVLGCTHYLFIKDEINCIVGKEIAFIDGNFGTAKHLLQTLTIQNLLLDDMLRTQKEQVEFFSAGNSASTKNKYEAFFNYAMHHIYPEERK